MYRVAVYCRVSCNSDEQKNSLQAQQEYYGKAVIKNENCLLVGIYADIASGVNKKKRIQFNKLIKDCKKGKIDIIVTKSISRFARNTLDFLEVISMLKELNVDVYFENEKILLSKERNEFMMTTYAAIAQEESMIKSRSIKWGLENSFNSGNSKIAQRKCYGYTNDNGDLVVSSKQACIVKEIYKMYLEGLSLSSIVKMLYQKGVKSPTGKERWTVSAIDKILSNEKYVGNVLLQKTYVSDVLKHSQIKNNGEKAKYLYENSHEGIIDKETFDLVQIEKAKRGNTRIDNNNKIIRNPTRYSSGNTLSGKIHCGECGKNYRRITTHSGEIVWRCAGRVEKNGHCKNETIKQHGIDEKLREKYGCDFSLQEIYKMVESITVTGLKIDIE